MASANQKTFVLGQIVRISATFVGTDGAVADPDDVSLFIKTNDGDPQQFGYPGDIERDSAGKYALRFTIAAPGVHTYRWEGTGACQAATEGVFFVDWSPFG
ncbi:MAG: hypothetical protein GC191_09050 [Azospirillum sp.]|nr:hypothetical protein [Azospirillum sp.]